jgi:hypothetical protein
MKKSSEFLNSLTLPLQPVYDERRILASRYVIKEPTANSWVQVHPTQRLYPLAAVWRNDPIYGASYFLATNDVANELLPNQEYKRSALVLYRERANPYYFYLWIVRLNNNRAYEQQLDKLVTKHWAKTDGLGMVLYEDPGTPKQRIMNPDGIGDRIARPYEPPEIPAPWQTLPDMETIIKNAFRGRIIDSLSHPIVATLS